MRSREANCLDFPGGARPVRGTPGEVALSAEPAHAQGNDEQALEKYWTYANAQRSGGDRPHDAGRQRHPHRAGHVAA